MTPSNLQEILDKYPNFEDISQELSQATLLAFAKKGYATQILLKEGMLKNVDLKYVKLEFKEA